MFDTPFIDAKDHWTLLALLIVAGALGLWAERTRWGARLSAVVVTMGVAFALSNLSIIPSAAPMYDATWTYLVPLAIPLLLFRANLRRILKEAGATLVAFGIGGVGTLLGTVLAFHLVPLGQHSWQLAGIFAATYVGGALNFVATAKAVGLQSGDLLAAAMAADNLMMALYFMVIFALPGIPWLRRRYADRGYDPDRSVNAVGDDSGEEDTSEEDTSEEDTSEEDTSDGKLPLLELALALALSASLCALGFWLQRVTGLRGSGILFTTVFIVALATLFPHHLERLVPAERVGIFLMQIFFAVIGASANVAIVLRVGPILFLFAGVILSVHLLFLLVAGKLLRLDLAELVIASNANMGGPTTAAAMATARGWRRLVVPAILCGTLGYAGATFIGTALGFWLK
jgi:uncharacterized membrane protein